MDTYLFIYCFTFQVEVLSHYGSEFFCPISLFRIYGLSEFEVIDTIEDVSEDSEDSEETFTEAVEEENSGKKHKGNTTSEVEIKIHT